MGRRDSNGAQEGIVGCLGLLVVLQRSQQVAKMDGRREANMFGSGSSGLMKAERKLAGQQTAQSILGCPGGFGDQGRCVGQGKLTCMIQLPQV